MVESEQIYTHECFRCGSTFEASETEMIESGGLCETCNLEEEEIDIREHIEIDVAIPAHIENGYWLHTHGMSHFDKPDLEMVEVPGLLAGEAARIINHIAQHMAEGAQIEAGQTMDIGYRVAIRFIPGDPDRHTGNECLRITEAHLAKCQEHE